MMEQFKLNFDSKPIREIIEILTDFGYRENQWGRNDEITISDDGFEAVKTWHQEKIAVTFECWRDRIQNKTWFYFEAYEYKGEYNKHEKIGVLTDTEAIPFLQELIDCDLILES